MLRTIEEIRNKSEKMLGRSERQHLWRNNIFCITTLSSWLLKIEGWSEIFKIFKVCSSQKSYPLLEDCRKVISNFCRCALESILMGGISAECGNSYAFNRLKLQRVVKAAQSLTGSFLPSIQSIFMVHFQGRLEISSGMPVTLAILQSPWPFPFLPSTFCEKLQQLKAQTSVLQNSFFPAALRPELIISPTYSKS